MTPAQRKRAADEIRDSPCDKPGVLAKRGKPALPEIDLHAPEDPKFLAGVRFNILTVTSPGFSLEFTDTPTLAKIMKTLAKGKQGVLAKRGKRPPPPPIDLDASEDLGYYAGVPARKRLP